MTILLFLLGMAMVVMVAGSVKQSHKTSRYLAKKLKKHSHLPKALSLLILAAQASELVRVLEHASLINISAALFILMIIVAAKSGTERQEGH